MISSKKSLTYLFGSAMVTRGMLLAVTLAGRVTGLLDTDCLFGRICSVAQSGEHDLEGGLISSRGAGCSPSESEDGRFVQSGQAEKQDDAHRVQQAALQQQPC